VSANDVDPLPVVVPPLVFVPLYISLKFSVPVMTPLLSAPVNPRVCVESTVPGPLFGAKVCTAHVMFPAVPVMGPE
jgi:hypothetical protein